MSYRKCAVPKVLSQKLGDNRAVLLARFITRSTAGIFPARRVLMVTEGCIFLCDEALDVKRIVAYKKVEKLRYYDGSSDGKVSDLLLVISRESDLLVHFSQHKMNEPSEVDIETAVDVIKTAYAIQTGALLDVEKVLSKADVAKGASIQHHGHSQAMNQTLSLGLQSVNSGSGILSGKRAEGEFTDSFATPTQDSPLHRDSTSPSALPTAPANPSFTSTAGPSGLAATHRGQGRGREGQTSAEAAASAAVAAVLAAGNLSPIVDGTAAVSTLVGCLQRLEIKLDDFGSSTQRHFGFEDEREHARSQLHEHQEAAQRQVDQLKSTMSTMEGRISDMQHEINQLRSEVAREKLAREQFEKRRKDARAAVSGELTWIAQEMDHMKDANGGADYVQRSLSELERSASPGCRSASAAASPDPVLDFGIVDVAAEGPDVVPSNGGRDLPIPVGREGDPYDKLMAVLESDIDPGAVDVVHELQNLTTTIDSTDL